MKNNFQKRLLYSFLVLVIGFSGFFAGTIYERTSSLGNDFISNALKTKKVNEIIEEKVLTILIN